MANKSAFNVWIIVITAIAVVGCRTTTNPDRLCNLVDQPPPISASPGPDYLEMSEAENCEPAWADGFGPDMIQDYRTVEHVPISLQECVSSALSNTRVIRDLGVAVVRSPGSMVSQYDPALAYTDARFGEEASLSAFDANIVTQAYFQKNDRAFNNLFFGNTNGVFQQDLLKYNVELNKTAATGGRYALRHFVDYDANNQAGNRYGSSWQTIIESEVRQPLLQGGGVWFNRIAGPSQQPGVYNGVLIARTNTEIGLTKFEQGVRDLVSNVENAYWDLYFAYRELESQIAARDAAYELWQRKEKNFDASDIERVSAKEQYLRFETNIINSLEGQLTDGTRTDGGSSGGSFRGTVGVRLAERRLRYLVGHPITDGRLLQPSDTPYSAATTFDWTDCIQTAFVQRPEIRQQNWVIKQRQLELTAAKNFLLPRLDLVATQRFRGLGHDLTGGSNTYMDDVNAGGGAANSNAFGDLLSGDFTEWQVGAEMSAPIGFRRGHNAVRYAELRLQREQSMLNEQQRAISLSLSNAIGESRRALSAMQMSERRFQEASLYKKQANELLDQNKVKIDVLLEAERRMLEARTQFIRSEAEYMIAIKNVHFEKGTLLDYNHVYLNEAESDSAAYSSAANRANRRRQSVSYVLRNPVVTAQDVIN